MPRIDPPEQPYELTEDEIRAAPLEDVAPDFVRWLFYSRPDTASDLWALWIAEEAVPDE